MKKLDLGSDKWNEAIDRVVLRTARKVSRALDEMVVGLPEGGAPQAAFELLVRELAHLQPWMMSLLMDDHEFRETYEAAVAERPARAVHDSIY
jgi:hypothetical protein